MTDAWGDIASEQIVSPRRAQIRAAEKRRQKRLKERDQLFTLWKKWHQERRDALLTGAWGGPARELADFIEGMSLDDAPALVHLIEQGPWHETDRDTQFLVMSMISHGIVYLRESAGLEPFDDPLPGEEPNAFLMIREMLT